MRAILKSGRPGRQASNGRTQRKITATRGRTLVATPVFDTYWRFAAARQQLFQRRIEGLPPPWTTDPIIGAHRFTNVYRASDRVSQYLIAKVIYHGPQDADEVVFRTLLFKFFNKIETWERLQQRFGVPTWKAFDFEAYSSVLDEALKNGQRLYSAAYIMPSPPFGNARKHRNHLRLLQRMMQKGAAKQIGDASSLRAVYETLRSFPSLGDFLAFQFAIDLNYSEVTDFSEMDFVVAGPGARDGIRKCFSDAGGLDEREIIEVVAKMADEEFERLRLTFPRLGGSRPLQLIDCQNLFCEVDKYARVAHP
jgi:hypothetical protein